MNWSTKEAAAAVKDKKGVFWRKITCSYFQYLRASGGVDGNIWKMKRELSQAQRGKRKGNGRASPSPSEGGDVPGGVGVGTEVCGRKAIKFLIEKGRRISLYSAKTLQ